MTRPSSEREAVVRELCDAMPMRAVDALDRYRLLTELAERAYDAGKAAGAAEERADGAKRGCMWCKARHTPSSRVPQGEEGGEG